MFMMAVKETVSVFAASSSALAGTLPTCPILVDTGKWFGGQARNTATNRDLMEAVDSFYTTATALPVPIIYAVVYGLMKVNGATPQELDQYRSLMVGTIPFICVLSTKRLSPVIPWSR
jgi:hypothetical protein